MAGATIAGRASLIMTAPPPGSILSVMPPAHVVLAILDAFPHAHVTPEFTPTLWSLIEEGGRAPKGGRAVLAASTYPNHATFVTGVTPEVHGIVSNKIWLEGKLVPAQEVGPAVPTLFDHCAKAGRRAVAAFGDQNLVGVCGALGTDAHWPPQGVLPEDAPRGRLNYGADRAVVAGVDALDLEAAELIVLQLDEVDMVRHLFGPAAPESIEQFRATDAALGEVLERFEADWQDTVVIALSDHDQEAVSEGAIDLVAETKARGLDLRVAHEGTAAVISTVEGTLDQAVLMDLPGVTGVAPIGDKHAVVWGSPGQQFGIDWGLKAQHGSPRTATQMAIVGGGHPAAKQLAKRMQGAPPDATAWAGVVRDLMDLP